MTLYKWSMTAANNATADSSINWAEGQAPSSVNDSARAEMAAVAKFRDDISGAITTGGSATAYTVTSSQGFNSLANMSGKMIAFVPHTTSGATVTLNVDGLGAKPLRSAPSAELSAGVLVQGTPYVATYSNATQEWPLHGFYGDPYSIPLGGMLEFTGPTVPNSSFVLPFGQAISRTAYTAYFAMVGTTYGVGDGSTTFNVIDKRGRVSAGKDAWGLGDQPHHQRRIGDRRHHAGRGRRGGKRHARASQPAERRAQRDHPCRTGKPRPCDEHSEYRRRTSTHWRANKNRRCDAAGDDRLDGIDQWRGDADGAQQDAAHGHRELHPADSLEHDPEKWLPVFGKACPRARPEGSCSNKKLERDDDSKRSHHALAGAGAHLTTAAAGAGSCSTPASRRPATPGSGTWSCAGAAGSRRNRYRPRSNSGSLRRC
jgi:hypothetical protein